MKMPLRRLRGLKGFSVFWFAKATTNPFTQAKDSLADALELQARHLNDKIVESSFSILVGQEMWSIEWDDQKRSNAEILMTSQEYV